MQKIGRASAQVAGRFLFLGVSVQILLGICWGVRSFGIFPEFGDSYTWLKASETLVCDDYMGIGYPLFLMLVKGIESISSIPYTFFVYTVQILIAFYAGVVFLRACGVTGKKIFLCWGSLALLTFPCAMQSHLAVLPNSPGYSFLLLELSAVIRILRQDAVAEDGETTAPARPLHGLFEAGIWWALSTLCVVENLYLGLVPLIVLWLIHLWQLRSRKTEKKRVGRELLLLLAMAGILFTLVPMWQTPGSYGKAENTVSAAMMRRFSWTHMREEEEYDEWPEQLRTWMTWKEMRNAGYYAGTMESGIQKTLEDRFGKAEAQKIFREYAEYHLKTYTSDNIHQIAWDCLGYAMPTVLLQLLLDGRGYDSFSGRNDGRSKADRAFVKIQQLVVPVGNRCCGRERHDMRDHCHAPTEKRKNSTGQKPVLEDIRSLCDHCGRHDPVVYHAGCRMPGLQERIAAGFSVACGNDPLDR